LQSQNSSALGVDSGVQSGGGRRPRVSKARGASKEWNYKNWNAASGWFFLL